MQFSANAYVCTSSSDGIVLMMGSHVSSKTIWWVESALPYVNHSPTVEPPTLHYFSPTAKEEHSRAWELASLLPITANATRFYPRQHVILCSTVAQHSPLPCFVSSSSPSAFHSYHVPFCPTSPFQLVWEERRGTMCSTAVHTDWPQFGN